VAAVQFRAGTDPEANLKTLDELSREATEGGARLVVAPEFAMYGVIEHPKGASDVAQSLDGPFVQGLHQLAAELGVTLVAGMIERVDDISDGRPYNTVVAVSPDGLLGFYRKLHLYDAFGFAESEMFRPGAHGPPLLLNVEGFSFGVLTCYDLRFPELGRVLVDAGAEAIVVPAAWVAGPNKEDHWTTLLRARAIENTCYVLGAGQSGPKYVAHSCLVDPMGLIVAAAGEVQGAVSGIVSTERLDEVRRVLPSLRDRRFDVVPRKGQTP
jgi:predicted amidohydrolase